MNDYDYGSWSYFYEYDQSFPSSNRVYFRVISGHSLFKKDMSKNAFALITDSDFSPEDAAARSISARIGMSIHGDVVSAGQDGDHELFTIKVGHPTPGKFSTRGNIVFIISDSPIS